MSQPAIAATTPWWKAFWSVTRPCSKPRWESPDPIRGMVVKAFVVLREGTLAERLARRRDPEACETDDCAVQIPGLGSKPGNRAVRTGVTASVPNIIAGASEPDLVIGRGWLLAGMHIDTRNEVEVPGWPRRSSAIITMSNHYFLLIRFLFERYLRKF